MKEERKPEYLEKNPNNELQKASHKAQKFNPDQDWNLHSSAGGKPFVGK